jgi:DNA-binding response OmpR family regulator
MTMEETIYIVEDDFDIGELVYYLLHSLGKKAHILNTIAAFNHQMDNLMPDLIILDARLPDGNGLTLCNQLKNNPDTQHIPIIMMSANETMLADSTCKADGAVQKPFRIADFESSILRHLKASSN